MADHIIRKYDFVDGHKAYSAEVDDELNQLVAVHNSNADEINAVKTQATAGDAALATHKGSSDHDGRYYTEAEINAKEAARDTRNSADEAALATHKGAADHDGRYYTETEIDGKFQTSDSALIMHKGSSDHDSRYPVKAEIMQGGGIVTNKQTFTSTEGQTLFTLTNGSYKIGANVLNVSIDGVVQPSTAYTETSSTSFTFTEALPEGLQVQAWWYGTVSSSHYDSAHSSTHSPGSGDTLEGWYATKENVSQNTASRKNICFNTLWTSTKTENDAISDINKMLPMCDDIVFAIYTTYSTGVGIGANASLEAIDAGVAYAVSKGMKVKAVKFHYKPSESGILADMSLDLALTAYYNFISAFMTAHFSGYDVEYITVLNEDSVLYNNSANAASIAAHLTAVHNLGYKVSLTLENSYDLFTLSPTIANACDAFCINMYPAYSMYGKYATLDQFEMTFNRYVNNLRAAKRLYPTKPIIISEVGCPNSWDCLLEPYTYRTTNPSGIPNYYALKGLLGSKFANYIDGAWIWYYSDTYVSPQASAFLKSYKSSGNLRG